jgi:hypothetical protein
METEKQNRKLWTMAIRPVDEPIMARLYDAAEKLGLPTTQIVRLAIREKLDRLSVEYPHINEVLPQTADCN